MLGRTVQPSGELQAQGCGQKSNPGVILLDNEQSSLVLESNSLNSSITPLVYEADYLSLLLYKMLLTVLCCFPYYSLLKPSASFKGDGFSLSGHQ